MANKYVFTRKNSLKEKLTLPSSGNTQSAAQGMGRKADPGDNECNPNG